MTTAVSPVWLLDLAPFPLPGRNLLFQGRPLPGLGREAGLQGLREHLRLQRLAAAAGETLLSQQDELSAERTGQGVGALCVLFSSQGPFMSFGEM